MGSYLSASGSYRTLTAIEEAVNRLNETYAAFVELEQRIVRYLPDFYGLEYTKRVGPTTYRSTII